MTTPVEEPLPAAWGSYGCVHGRVIQPASPNPTWTPDVAVSLWTLA